MLSRPHKKLFNSTCFVQVNIYGVSIGQLKRKGADVTKYLSAFGIECCTLTEVSFDGKCKMVNLVEPEEPEVDDEVPEIAPLPTLRMPQRTAFKRHSTPIHDDGRCSDFNLTVSTIASQANESIRLPKRPMNSHHSESQQESMGDNERVKEPVVEPVNNNNNKNNKTNIINDVVPTTRPFSSELHQKLLKMPKLTPIIPQSLLTDGPPSPLLQLPELDKTKVVPPPVDSGLGTPEVNNENADVSTSGPELFLSFDKEGDQAGQDLPPVIDLKTLFSNVEPMTLNPPFPISQESDEQNPLLSSKLGFPENNVFEPTNHPNELPFNPFRPFQRSKSPDFNLIPEQSNGDCKPNFLNISTASYSPNMDNLPQTSEQTANAQIEQYLNDFINAFKHKEVAQQPTSPYNNNKVKPDPDANNINKAPPVEEHPTKQIPKDQVRLYNKCHFPGCLIEISRRKRAGRHQLYAHARTHIHSKRFQCDTCEYRGSCKSQMRNHCKQKHPEKIEPAFTDVETEEQFAIFVKTFNLCFPDVYCRVKDNAPGSWNLIYGRG